MKVAGLLNVKCARQANTRRSMPLQIVRYALLAPSVQYQCCRSVSCAMLDSSAHQWGIQHAYPVRLAFSVVRTSRPVSRVPQAVTPTRQMQSSACCVIRDLLPTRIMRARVCRASLDHITTRRARLHARSAMKAQYLAAEPQHVKIVFQALSPLGPVCRSVNCAMLAIIYLYSEVSSACNALWVKVRKG